MKRFVKIYAYWLLSILLFTGCDDYLKEDSGDLLIPKKVEEYLPMLYREGFPRNFNEEVAWLYLMSDDVEMGNWSWTRRMKVMNPGIKMLKMLLIREREKNLTSGTNR